MLHNVNTALQTCDWPLCCVRCLSGSTCIMPLTPWTCGSSTRSGMISRLFMRKTWTLWISGAKEQKNHTNNSPMGKERGQVLIIRYVFKDGFEKNQYCRSSGLAWQGMPSTEEIALQNE